MNLMQWTRLIRTWPNGKRFRFFCLTTRGFQCNPYKVGTKNASRFSNIVSVFFVFPIRNRLKTRVCWIKTNSGKLPVCHDPKWQWRHVIDSLVNAAKWKLKNASSISIVSHMLGPKWYSHHPHQGINRNILLASICLLWRRVSPIELSLFFFSCNLLNNFNSKPMLRFFCSNQIGRFGIWSSRPAGRQPIHI